MNTKELVEISYFIDKIEEESSLYKDTESDSEKLYKIIQVLRDSISSNKQFEKFVSFFDKNNQVLDCTFTNEENIESSLERLKK